MDAPVEVTDKPDAKELEVTKGEIEFHDVSFEYEDDSTPVLSHINLKIGAGERVALVGSSGGGKTTLCNLVPRFFDVTAERC